MKKGIYPRLVLDESWFEIPILCWVFLKMGFVPWRDGPNGGNLSESHLSLIQGKREPLLFVVGKGQYPSELYTSPDLVDIAPEAYLYNQCKYNICI